MGVVYKLHKEVVDFIVGQKNKNPALGCRMLAELTSQHTNSRVSKSSVNAVLKEFQLSSPVGRRVFYETKSEPKKFYIPEEKKQQIFTGLQETQADKKVFSSGPSQKTGALAPKAKPTLPAKNTVSLTSEISTPTIPQKTEEIVCQNAGSVFWQAIQAEMAEHSILGKYLHEKMSTGTSAEIDSVADTLVLSWAQGIKNPQEILNKQSLAWGLCGLEKVRNPEGLVKEFFNLSAWDDIESKMAIDLPSTLTQISNIKILLEDQTMFVIDAQQNTVWPDNVQSGQYMFLEKCLDIVTKKLLNNVQSVILKTLLFSREESIFPSEFYSMLYAFENMPGKRMVKISLHDRQGQEMVILDTIPNKKRSFMAGVWPSQPRFKVIQELFRKEKDAKFQSTIIGLGQKIYFQEMIADLAPGQKKDLAALGRVFLLFEDPQSSPAGAIITNTKNTEILSQNVVYSFLQRWPDLNQGISSSLFEETDKKGGFSSDNYISQYISTPYSPENVLDAIAKPLNQHTLCRFFPDLKEENPAELLSAISSLSARLSSNQNLSKIEFIIPKGKPFLFQPQIERAIFIFNQSEIRDSSRRQMVLGLS